MKTFILLAFGLWAAVLAHGQTVTQCEWFTGTDPGPGNGNAIAVGVPNDSVGLNFTVGTGSLNAGLLRVNVRCRTSSGTWGVPVPQFLVVAPGAQAPRAVTHMDVAVDGGAPTTIDVADGPQAILNQLVATGSLNTGLHRFKVRARDDLGRTGVYHDGFFLLQNNPAVARLVTHFEFWFDNNAPTVVDVTDGATVNFNQIVATAALGNGLHRFRMRARDDLGRTGAVHDAFLLVHSPVAQGRTLAAAEFYVDTDPGAGNATPLPLPVDGAWNEAEETVQTTLLNLNPGPHFFAVRMRDDLGRWSAAHGDTILVNMALVVQVVAGQLVLSWTADGGAPYHVYRADLSTGPFTEIAVTDEQTYTDTGIINAATKKFYYVTQTLNGAAVSQPPPEPAGH